MSDQKPNPREWEGVPEYSPLEALLACLLDGYETSFKVSDEERARRVRKAHQEITGVAIRHMDDPASLRTRALFRMRVRAYQDYVAQLLPEHGGAAVGSPLIEERSVLQLAKEVVKELGLNESEVEVLRRRYAGTYRAKQRGKPGVDELGGAINPEVRERAERLHRDLLRVERILARHGIRMRLDRVFWRLLEEI